MKLPVLTETGNLNAGLTSLKEENKRMRLENANKLL